MNKQLKKTLTIILSCLVVLLGATLFLSTDKKTAIAQADETAEKPVTEITGYNLYDVNQAKWPNSKYNEYLNLSNSTDEYKDFECIKDFGELNLIFRNPYMYYEGGVTYQVSYKIQAIEGSGDTWKVYPRAIIDGTICGMENETTAQDGEWTVISYTFTPSKTSSETTDNKNCFDFVFEKFVENDIVQIKDIKVLYPKSAETKANLWNNSLKFGNPATVDQMDVTDAADDVYGTVKKYQLKDGIDKQNINIRTDFVWKENVKYHVSFVYKTGKGVSNSFSQGYCIVRAAGRANVIVGGNVLSSNYKGLEYPGEWKMFNFDFEVTDDYPAANAAQTSDTFDIFLVGFNPGDVFYITNFRITAECNNHDSVAQYIWAEDNSTCTASYTKCTICGTVPAITETVTATSVDTATCTEDGVITYTATFENEEFETQTKEAESKAKGHAYGEVVYTWSEDNTECTATRTCTVDGCTEKIEEKATVSKTEVPATCTEKGKITYTATFENEEFEAQTKEVEIKAKGHSYKDGKCESCGADDPDYVKPAEEKSGCKSSIGVTFVYLAFVLVAATVFVTVKTCAKKKD